MSLTPPVYPVVFAGMQWVETLTIEAGSLTYTSVVLLLPLGTLVAQRLTGSRNNSQSGGSLSSWNSKPSATYSSVTSSNPHSRVVTNIEVPRSKDGLLDPYPVDIELQWPEQRAERAGGVRVRRELDQTVENLI